MPLLWKSVNIPKFYDLFLAISFLSDSFGPRSRTVPASQEYLELTPSLSVIIVCSSRFWRRSWTRGGNQTLHLTPSKVKELRFRKTLGRLEILVHYRKYHWGSRGDKILLPWNYSAGNAMKNGQPRGRGQPRNRGSSIPREFIEMYLQFSSHILILFVTQGF